MKNNRLCHRCGYTLFELLITLAIMAILAMLVLPSGLAWLRQAEARKVENQLPQLLRNARAHALSQRDRLGVCGSSSGQGCDGQWQKGLLTFRDLNQDSQKQPEEAVVDFLPLDLRYGTLSWRAAGGRTVIIYQAANGLPLASNGSLVYCTFDHNPRLYRQVILSMMGHVDASRDQNGDGLYEGTDGKPINCA